MHQTVLPPFFLLRGNTGRRINLIFVSKATRVFHFLSSPNNNGIEQFQAYSYGIKAQWRPRRKLNVTHINIYLSKENCIKNVFPKSENERLGR